MSSFPEKTDDHLLRSASCASNFWIYLILKTHTVDCCLLLIRVNPRFITCHDVVIDVFQSTPIEFLKHFFRPINASQFFERLTNCPMRTHFFLTIKCSCNIECMLVPLMPKVVSISWRSCNISWRTASRETDIGRPSRNSSWSELRPRLNSPYHRLILVLDGPSLPKIELSSSMHCCWVKIVKNNDLIPFFLVEMNLSSYCKQHK